MREKEISSYVHIVVDVAILPMEQVIERIRFLLDLLVFEGWMNPVVHSHERLLCSTTTKKISISISPISCAFIIRSINPFLPA